MPNGPAPAEQDFQQPNIDALVEKTLNEAYDPRRLARAGNMLGNALKEAGRYVLGLILKGAAGIALVLVRILMEAEEFNDRAFGQLAAAGVEDLTGVSVDPSAFHPRNRRGARGAAARQIGAVVLEAITQIKAGAGATGLVPSSAGAEQYMTFVTQLAIEGWLEGGLVSLIPWGIAGQFGELDDIMAKVLGLERITRAVVRPALSAGVVVPFQWKINREYRPELLSPAEAARQFWRGRWSREQVFEELARQGWSDERIEAILNAQRKFLSPDDADLAVRADVWTREEALAHLQDQGWDADLATTRLTLERARRRDAYQRQLADAALRAYVDRDISRPEFHELIDASVADRELRAQLKELGEQRRILHVRQLARGDVEEAVKRGILAFRDYRAWAQREGYQPDDVTTLELLLRAEIKGEEEARAERARLEAERRREREEREAERRRRRAELELQRAATAPSLAQVERAVVRGLLSLEQYQAFLVEERYGADTIAFLSELALQERAAFVAQQRKREEAAADLDRAKVSLAALERAVERGILTIPEYRARLLDGGFTPADADLLVRLLESDLVELEAARRARERAARRLAERDLSLADVERAVRFGISSLADYQAFLGQQGFDVGEQALLVRLLSVELAQEAEARRVRDEAAARLAARQLSLADVERAVRRGIKTLDEYALFLGDQRFSPEDRQTLVALMRAQLADDAAARARRAQIEATIPSPELTLGQVEHAVRAGVLPLDAYRRFVADLGYAARDVELLAAVLAEDLAAAARARARRDQVERELAARQLSAAQLAQAVTRELRTLEDYRAFLLGAGYGTADAELLVSLLEAEIAQRQTAKKRRAVIAEKLAAQGIVLDQVEAAVQDGRFTLDDYTALLTEAQVKPADVGILVGLLLPQLAPAAAAGPA